MNRRQAGAMIAALLAALALGEEAPGAAERAQAPVAQTVEIGRSVKGRPILATELGDHGGPRKVLVVGVMHGDEPAGLAVVRQLRQTFSEPGIDLWLIDAVNPDGLHAHRRTNAHRVDLNRNFSFHWQRGRRDGYYPGPGPFSEPESRAVRDFAARLKPTVTIWYHQPWNAVLRPCRGAAEIQRAYARLAGMKTSCRGHGLHGTAINWQNHFFPATTAMVVELPPHPDPSLILRNAEAAARVIAG